jgi:hypothetical protein
VIFSLERLLSGGTKLTQEYANKLGKPVLHIFDTFNPDSLSLEIQALTNFLCSNKIEILNVAGPREYRIDKNIRYQHIGPLVRGTIKPRLFLNPQPLG